MVHLKKRIEFIKIDKVPIFFTDIGDSDILETIISDVVPVFCLVKDNFRIFKMFDSSRIRGSFVSFY